MERKKACFVVSCLVLACLLSITSVQGNPGQKAESRLGATTGFSGLVVHDPIHINGNAALASFCAGNGTDGTQSNPYIIQNYEINASTAIGIDIENTNACLVIRDCVIENGNGSEFGIYLEHTTSVNVSNNTLSKIANGIGVDTSSNTTITGNTCPNNGDAIYLSDANNTSNFRQQLPEQRQWDLLVWCEQHHDCRHQLLETTALGLPCGMRATTRFPATIA